MKRNLIYFIYPEKCSLLSFNLQRFSHYWNRFNGRKIVCFVTNSWDVGTEDNFHWMFMCLGMLDAEKFVRGIDSNYFIEMLSQVQSTNPDEITFIGNTMGIYPHLVRPVLDLSRWVESSYRTNLEDLSRVESSIRGYPCAGAYKTGSNSSWGYKGHCFWINHERFFEYGLNGTHEMNDYLFHNFSPDQGVDLGGENTRPILGNFSPANVSVVTTCMNRLDFLRQSIETWLSLEFKEIVVVDWSSDKPIREELRGCRVVRVNGETVFNAGLARNTGFKYTTSNHILFMDSDIRIVEPGVIRGLKLERGLFYHGPDVIPPFGTSFISRDDFESVNGYSENMPAYGFEDNDLYLRLEEAGCLRYYYDERFVEHIDHSDDLRSCHRGQEGKSLFDTVKMNRNKEKWGPHCHHREVSCEIYDL